MTLKLKHIASFFIPFRHRSAFAKFRCGVAPLRLETGRYENIALDARLCTFCNANTVETEMHVMLDCDMYDDFRTELYSKAINIVPDFLNLSDNEKFIILFSNCDIMKECAKTCCNILKRRRAFLYR